MTAAARGSMLCAREDVIFRLLRIASAAVVVLGTTGCFGTEVTEFPDGLEPLDVNELAPPEGTADDPYPEEFVLEGIDGGRYDTVLGRGYIQADIRDVWAAYRDPAVGADRRTSPDWTTTPLEDPMYDATYLVHHITYDIVTVEWDVTWRHGLVEGTDEAPEVVAMRWQKTDGSTLISTIDGSIVLRPTADGSATEVELAYHANATGAGLDSYLRYMQDVFDDAVAVTHGEALPTYE